MQSDIPCLFITVAPDAIYSHVKSCREEAKNMHYIAPENAGEHLAQFMIGMTFITLHYIDSGFITCLGYKL